jgi:hypothetical protein
MTSQVRPIGGGAWNNISLTTQKVSKKDTVYGVTLPAALASSALRAMNEWVNCAGVGTAAVRAQNVAGAVGLQLQEV